MTDSEHVESRQETTELELAKLRCETTILQKQAEEYASRNIHQERLIRWMPLFTTLIAAGTFIFSIVQFTNSQARDRDARERDRVSQARDREAQEQQREQLRTSQIRADLGELVRYATDKSRTAASAVYLLNDLDFLTKGSPEDRRAVTEVILHIIIYDFEDPSVITENAIRFDNIANDNWKDYLAHLEDVSSANVRVLRRYFRLMNKYANDKKNEDHSLFREVLRNAIYRHGKRMNRAKQRPDDFADLAKQIMHITNRSLDEDDPASPSPHPPASRLRSKSESPRPSASSPSL